MSLHFSSVLKHDKLFLKILFEIYLVYPILLPVQGCVFYADLSEVSISIYGGIYVSLDSGVHAILVYFSVSKGRMKSQNVDVVVAAFVDSGTRN